MYVVTFVHVASQQRLTPPQPPLVRGARMRALGMPPRTQPSTSREAPTPVSQKRALVYTVLTRVAWRPATAVFGALLHVWQCGGQRLKSRSPPHTHRIYWIILIQNPNCLQHAYSTFLRVLKSISPRVTAAGREKLLSSAAGLDSR
jgi:hypothetical protein